MRCSFVTPRCRVAEKLYVASNYVVTPGSESCPLELFLLGHSRGYMYTSPELIFSGKVWNRRLEEGGGMSVDSQGLVYPIPASVHFFSSCIGYMVLIRRQGKAPRSQKKERLGFTKMKSILTWQGIHQDRKGVFSR